MLAANSLPAIVEHDDDLALHRQHQHPRADIQLSRFAQQTPDAHSGFQIQPPVSPKVFPPPPTISSPPSDMASPQPVQYWTPVHMPPSPSHSPQFPSSPDSSPPTPSDELALYPAPPNPIPSPDPASSTFVRQQEQAKPYPPPSQFQLQPAFPAKDGLRHQASASSRPALPRKPTPLRVSTTAHQHGSDSSSRFSLSSGFVWIGLYFVFNMGLTLYNKKILVHFPFPYSLTALHTFCGTVGCYWLKQIGYFTPARLTPRQNFILALFSVLYTMNIAVSNISLQLVTVPFHQVVRATAPAFTILVAYLLGATRGKGLLGVGGTKLTSLVPVVAGVGFATYGDYSFTTWGLVLTLFGTFLAALKTVLTSILQTSSQSSKLATPLPTSTPLSPIPRRKDSDAGGYEYVGAPSVSPPPTTAPKSPSFHKSFLTAKLDAQRAAHDASSAGYASKLKTYVTSLWPRVAVVTRRFDLDFGLQSQSVMSTSIKLHPLDLLMRMSPLAFVQCIYYAWASGEMERAMLHKGPGAAGWSKGSATGLLLNGIIAFLLNIVSLTANQKNGPLTMTVAANVKQVLTILLAMYMFNLSVNPANAVGICLTLAGGAWYGALEYAEKKTRIRSAM